ncbi:MAG: hypothetical protein WCR52_20495 [Bacteroidota bacterium]
MQILDDEFTLPDQAEGDLLSGRSLQSLQAVANWALFLSVTGLAISVLLWLAFMVIGQMMGTMMETMIGGNPILSVISPFFGIISVVLTVMIAIHVAILALHTRFAIRLRRSLQLNDQPMFVKAWKDMRNLMRIFGILMGISFLFGMFVIYLVMSMSAIMPSN